MPHPQQFLRQPKNHPFGAAVKLWRHGLCERRDLGDSHLTPIIFCHPAFEVDSGGPSNLLCPRRFWQCRLFHYRLWCRTQPLLLHSHQISKQIAPSGEA